MKRRLKPQFKSYALWGFILLWVPWTILWAYHTYVSDLYITREILSKINYLQIGYAIGIILQSIDNRKQYKELLEHMAKITVGLLVKMDAHYKEKYEGEKNE